MRLIFLVLFTLLSSALNAEADFFAKKTASEIAPEKKVSGQAVYEQFCSTCHRDGLVGAPKLGKIEDWKPRLGGKTLDDLVASAMKGLNAMPEKGTCFECTNEEIKAAIEYMLPEIKDDDE